MIIKLRILQRLLQVIPSMKKRLDLTYILVIGQKIITLKQVLSLIISQLQGWQESIIIQNHAMMLLRIMILRNNILVVIKQMEFMI